MSADIVKRLTDNIADYERMNQSGTLLSDAKAEIERLRKLLEPSVWTCPDQEGSAWSCPDDAMDGADTGDSSELEGWARVAAVRATVQPDNSVKIETLI